MGGVSRRHHRACAVAAVLTCLKLTSDQHDGSGAERCNGFEVIHETDDMTQGLSTRLGAHTAQISNITPLKTTSIGSSSNNETHHREKNKKKNVPQSPHVLHVPTHRDWLPANLEPSDYTTTHSSSAGRHILLDLGKAESSVNAGNMIEPAWLRPRPCQAQAHQEGRSTRRTTTLKSHYEDDGALVTTGVPFHSVICEMMRGIAAGMTVAIVGVVIEAWEVRNARIDTTALHTLFRSSRACINGFHTSTAPTSPMRSTSSPVQRTLSLVIAGFTRRLFVSGVSSVTTARNDIEAEEVM
ncbi:hypothetical protein M422DRAFT_247690 [Sphaerobolus stellatus SS14]|nr:hypothetical protein M422DRAFT_247690 [Sphaerobolus stellatus SS14]